MTKQLLWIVFAIFVVPIVEYFIGLQVLQLGAMVQTGTLAYDITFNFGMYWSSATNKGWFWVITFLVILSVLYILWINVIRLRFGKNGLRDKDGKPIKEEDIRHLASTFEAKRGLQRIDFSKDGEAKQNSWRYKVDLFLDKPKKLYNKIAKKVFKASDRKLLNTIKEYPNKAGVGGEMTRFKSGIPVIFKKNRVYVDANDNHSLIIGTTNSGKTYSYVSPMIEIARMCRESLVINDVKGELYKKHAGTLKKSGYKVLQINYIEPKKSDQNNPFGTIIKRYRQAYYDNQDEIQREHMDKATELFNVLREIEFAKKEIKKLETKEENIQEAMYVKKDEVDTNEVIKEMNEIQAQKTEIDKKLALLRNRKRQLNDVIPKPNYSDAAELVADLANQLCYEKDAKDPFWFTSSMQLLEGYIFLLLEERVMTDKGYTDFIDKKYVNMYSVKMLHQQGQEKIKVDHKQMTLLEYYLKNYRKVTDNSVKSASAFLNAPDNTRGSIASTLETKIRYFLLNTDILNMTAESSFNLEDLAKTPTALFISVHDEKTTFHPLTTMLIAQIYEELIKESRNYPENLRLPVPINIIWDEFANGAPYPNIDNALTAGRSRGIKFHLFIQGLGQLENLYGPNKTKTIIDNCVNFVYILAQDDSTISKVSNMCGKKIIYSGRSRQTAPVFSEERLRMMSLGSSITIRQRMNPYITKSKGVSGFIFSEWWDKLHVESREINKDIEQAKYFDIVDAIISKSEEKLLQGTSDKKEKTSIPTDGRKVINIDLKTLNKEYTPKLPYQDGLFYHNISGEMIQRVGDGFYVYLESTEDELKAAERLEEGAFADEQ